MLIICKPAYAFFSIFAAKYFLSMRAKSNSYSEVQQTIDRQLADIQADNQRAAETDVAGRETVKPKYSLINKLKNMMKKKTMMMLLMLLMAAVGAKAQTHWTLTHDDSEGASTETPVYGKLDLGGATVLPENYEIAAFIGEEVRAVVTCKRENGTGNPLNLFELIVKGNYDQAAEADNGKAITFKLFNVMTGLEYDLTVSSTVTFDGNWHGISSMPLTFSVVEVQTLSLADFEMNVGQTVDLMTMLVKDPANATMPNGITWSVVGFENYLSVTADGKLTANAVGENLMVNFSYGQGNMGSATVTVKNPATAIAVKSGYETIIVNVGDATTLTQKLSEAIQLTPADATDRSRKHRHDIGTGKVPNAAAPLSSVDKRQHGHQRRVAQGMPVGNELVGMDNTARLIPVTATGETTDVKAAQQAFRRLKGSGDGGNLSRRFQHTGETEGGNILDGTLGNGGNHRLFQGVDGQLQDVPEEVAETQLAVFKETAHHLTERGAELLGNVRHHLEALLFRVFHLLKGFLFFSGYLFKMPFLLIKLLLVYLRHGLHLALFPRLANLIHLRYDFLLVVFLKAKDVELFLQTLHL